MSIPEGYITILEAVKISGFHPEYIRKLARKGLIRGQKWGTVWAIDRKSLEQYISEGHKPGWKPGKPRK